MKTHQDPKHHGQGSPTADRTFSKEHERIKETGISNAGGQRSDQTSNKNSAHKPERKHTRKGLL